MNLEEKREKLVRAKDRIKTLSYTPTIPYLHCCICFCELTEYNILEDNGNLINVCLDCENK